jgi:hypothetical protein
MTSFRLCILLAVPLALLSACGPSNSSADGGPGNTSGAWTHISGSSYDTHCNQTALSPPCSWTAIGQSSVLSFDFDGEDIIAVLYNDQVVRLNASTGVGEYAWLSLSGTGNSAEGRPGDVQETSNGTFLSWHIGVGPIFKLNPAQRTLDNFPYQDAPSTDGGSPYPASVSRINIGNAHLGYAPSTGELVSVGPYANHPVGVAGQGAIVVIDQVTGNGRTVVCASCTNESGQAFDMGEDGKVWVLVGASAYDSIDIRTGTTTRVASSTTIDHMLGPFPGGGVFATSQSGTSLMKIAPGGAMTPVVEMGAAMGGITRVRVHNGYLYASTLTGMWRTTATVFQ